MRRTLVLAFALLIALNASAQRRRAVRPPLGVPLAYRQLYLYLDNSLTYLQNHVEQLPAGGKQDVAFAAELITANGNRGADLLTAQALAGVRVNLDALQRLGVRAVAVTIVYPTLDPSFPRHDEYLAFFKSVASEVRSRRLKLIVKLSVAFTGTAFSNLNVDFSSLTVAKFAEGKRAMAEVVLRELAPDYLNLVGEPDTESNLTGLRALNDATTYAGVITTILSGLDRRQTKIGAGTGTWSSPLFAGAFAKTAIDYIDLHEYPAWPSTTDNLFAIADIAHRNGKSLAMTEAWLYKAGPDEGGDVAATADIFRRDVYSFWSPLDAKFLRNMVAFAKREQLEFVSPFWSALFFGNVTYSASNASLSYAQLTQLANRAAADAMVAGETTALGREYAHAIAP